MPTRYCCRLIITTLGLLVTVVFIIGRVYPRNITFLPADFNSAQIAPPSSIGHSPRSPHLAVSLSPENFDNRRLGNQLFNFASLIYVSQMTGRRVVMPRHHPHGWIDKWFQVDVEFVENITSELCPCSTISEQKPLVFDSSLASKLRHHNHEQHSSSSLASKLRLHNHEQHSSSSNTTLLLYGWFQSWKYTRGVDRRLRDQLTPRADLMLSVQRYLGESLPVEWATGPSRCHVTIGIHVRVGDVMDAEKYKFGYTIPRRQYFEKAMRRSVDEVGRGCNVQFIVVSDDVLWSRRTFQFTSIADKINLVAHGDVTVSVVFSAGRNEGFDLVLLSTCDAVVMTTGSFGWWGAWLANKTTYYFNNWPRPGSVLESRFKRDDFFPPNWIPIGGPYFEL